MKALLIRLLGSTETLPARIKVSADGVKTFTMSQESESFNHDSKECIQLQAARFAIQHWICDKWLEDNTLSIGQLPNGDYVVTMSAKPQLYRVESLSMAGLTVTDYFLGNRLDVSNAANKLAIEHGHYDTKIDVVKHFVGDCMYKDLT